MVIVLQKSDFVVWKKSFQLSYKNRDRAGGHQCNLNHEWDKADRKKLRRQRNKVIALGLQEHYLTIEEQQAEWDKACCCDEHPWSRWFGFEEFIEDESWDDPYGYSEFEGEEKDDFEDYDYIDPDSPEDLDTFMDRFDDFLNDRGYDIHE